MTIEFKKALNNSINIINLTKELVNMLKEKLYINNYLDTYLLEQHIIKIIKKYYPSKNMKNNEYICETCYHCRITHNNTLKCKLSNKILDELGNPNSKCTMKETCTYYEKTLALTYLPFNEKELKY